MAKPFKALREKMPADARERSELKTFEMLSEIRLADLRKALSLTQTELAERMGVSQAAISAFENQPDILLTTLSKYLEQLGAELVISARFPDGVVELTRKEL